MVSINTPINCNILHYIYYIKRFKNKQISYLMDINIWKTSNDETQNNAITTKINNLLESKSFGTKLLNQSNTKFDVLEKYVYDTAMYHLKRLNITENYCVEFWCKNKFSTHTLHVDCDENEKKKLNYLYPLLSCVTYFDNNMIPTIITNIDMERYMYKDFDDNIELFFSFPIINKQITFNPTNFHGAVALNENNVLNPNRTIIAINLWTTPPSNIEYYTSDENDNEKLYNNVDTILTLTESNVVPTEIKLSKKELNYNLLNNMLYKQSMDSCYTFNDLICHDTNQNMSGYKIVLDLTIEVTEFNLSLKNKYGDILNDINEIMEKKDLKYNRFLQRFIYKNIYTSDVCKWIIIESEKYAQQNGGWTTKRHNDYPTTDLPAEKIQSIFGFILNSFGTINTLVKKSYNLPDDIELNINDLFIVKYECDQQNYLELHQDGSFMSFNILLSNNSDFEGGGTYFDDGLTSKTEQGDLLIHSSKIKHGGNPITKGKRYLLVGFVNLQLVV